jgi:hypothetical protein
MVDASERLQVLLTQEENIYKTSDYMTRMKMGSQLMKTDRGAPSTTNGDESSPPSAKKKRKSWSSQEEAAQQSSCQGTQISDMGSTCDSDGYSTSHINKHWREKICEWAYQGKW